MKLTPALFYLSKVCSITFVCNFFIFPKFCSNFFILGFLFIFFPWFFCFKFLTTMLVSKSFCPGIYVFFFLSHKSWFQFFVQNVFLKILFPNFYSNFFFPFSAFIIFLDKKYWFKLLLFSFFLEFFSFSQSSLCLIFFLNFCSATNFDSNFLSKIYSEYFWTKKLIKTFTLSLFLI